MTIPAYLPYVVTIGAIGAIAIILLGLRNALANAGRNKIAPLHFVFPRSSSSAGFWLPSRSD
jgi:hypothetical protein